MNDIIRTILQEWKIRKLPAAKERGLNILPYFNLKVNKIITIDGFRRVGKTYYVYHIIHQLLKKYSREELLYINFEDERIPKKTAFLTALLPALKENYKLLPRYLFLDEIQEMPEWSKWVRRIYDNYEIKLILTGSSSKLSAEEIPYELRGRALELRLHPLSFNEYLCFTGYKPDMDKIENHPESKAEILAHFSEFLLKGGLPEVVLMDEERKMELVQSYYRTVIRRDLLDAFNIRNEELLKTLLQLLLQNREYTITKLYHNLKSMGLSSGKSTLQQYLSYIEKSLFASSLYAFSYKIKDRYMHPRKIYFIDNAFLNYVSYRFSGNSGRFYENLVFCELMRREKEIYYWKSAQGNYEIDFVEKRGEKIVRLIQVCVNLEDAKTREREIRALLKGSVELNCTDLYILTSHVDESKKETWFGNTGLIKMIPLWKWLLNKDNL